MTEKINPGWGSIDEYKWRQRRGILKLAELEAHFRRYAPEIIRLLDEGLIPRHEAEWLMDTHCYNVYKGKPEQI